MVKKVNYKAKIAKLKSEGAMVVRDVLKKAPRATLVIRSSPNKSIHFKEEYESEGDILKW